MKKQLMWYLTSRMFIARKGECDLIYREVASPIRGIAYQMLEAYEG